MEGRELELATMQKVSRRLIPYLFVLYVAAYLDRINIGFAQLQMKSALGFSDTVYGLGAGIFFLGYFLFEVPSNLILARIGARVWIARIMITWGLISSAMAIVRNPSGVLCAPVSPGRRRSRILPRGHLLFEPVVSSCCARLRDLPVHDRGCRLRHRRRSVVRGVVYARWHERPGGLAVDLRGRGYSFSPPRCHDALVPDRPASGGEMVVASGAGTSRRDDAERGGRHRASRTRQPSPCPASPDCLASQPPQLHSSRWSLQHQFLAPSDR